MSKAADPAGADDDIARALSVRSVAAARDGRLTRLPFSRREAEAIAALVAPGDLLRATDFAANREWATSPRLGEYRILHFATHGIINAAQPELSSLALSLVDERGRPRDGLLRMHDVYNQRLPLELVVLSACRTALGREFAGEGLVGLTRGFMYAGATRVVASLWQVDDLATAELMRRFYRRMLVDGRPPAAALRAAQVEMMNEPRWARPFLWAGFTIQGDWR
jgi:CHAT domain-containing protein